MRVPDLLSVLEDGRVVLAAREGRGGKIVALCLEPVSRSYGTFEIEGGRASSGESFGESQLHLAAGAYAWRAGLWSDPLDLIFGSRQG